MDEATQQAEPAAEAKPSRGLGSYLVWAFVVLMVYVLSVGPAQKFTSTNRAHRKFVTTVHAPVWWLYWNTPLRKPIGMYVHLWTPDEVNKDGYFSNVL